MHLLHTCLRPQIVRNARATCMYANACAMFVKCATGMRAVRATTDCTAASHDGRACLGDTAANISTRRSDGQT